MGYYYVNVYYFATRRGSIQTDARSPSIRDGHIIRPTSASSTVSNTSQANIKVVEDEVDQILSKEDGKVQRKRNDQL